MESVARGTNIEKEEEKTYTYTIWRVFYFSTLSFLSVLIPPLKTIIFNDLITSGDSFSVERKKKKEFSFKMWPWPRYDPGVSNFVLFPGVNLALKSVVILFSHGSLLLKSKSIGESTDKHVNIRGLGKSK